MKFSYVIEFANADDRNAAARACYEMARNYQRQSAKAQRRKSWRASERAMTISYCDRQAAIFNKLGAAIGGERPVDEQGVTLP